MARFVKLGWISFWFDYSPACLEANKYTFQPKTPGTFLGHPLCTSYLSYTHLVLIYLIIGENDDDSGSFLDWMNSSFKTHLLPCCRNLLSCAGEVVGKFGTLSQGKFIFSKMLPFTSWILLVCTVRSIFTNGENHNDNEDLLPILKPIYTPCGENSPPIGKFFYFRVIVPLCSGMSTCSQNCVPKNGWKIPENGAEVNLVSIPCCQRMSSQPQRFQASQ